MRLHRFIGDFDLGCTSEVCHERSIAHQLKHVLRARAGDEIILCDGAGREAHAKITAVDDSSFSYLLCTPVQQLPCLSREVFLFCALLKKDRFELVCQKATEIGVARIIPVKSARTIKHNVSDERLQRVIHEAAEQSGRGTVPLLGRAVAFAHAIKQAKDCAFSFFFDRNAPPFGSQIPQDIGGPIGVFIGPEGGWTDEERALATPVSHRASLGFLTLRAETAAIIATYLAVSDRNTQ